MLHVITRSTDGQHLGQEFEDTEAIVLSGSPFIPDAPKVNLGGGAWRFYNSNYSFDTQEVT